VPVAGLIVLMMIELSMTWKSGFRVSHRLQIT
jgi:hypothetical protein